MKKVSKILFAFTLWSFTGSAWPDETAPNKSRLCSHLCANKYSIESKTARKHGSKGFVTVVTRIKLDRPPSDYASYTQRVSSVTLIQPSREEAAVTIRNEMSYDVKCTGILSRVVYDNPNTYLEIGERTDWLSAVYIRGRSNVEHKVLVDGAYPVGTNIRAVSIMQPSQTCGRASVEDFCLFSKKSGNEQVFYERLSRFFGTKDCADFSRRARQVNSLDLSAWGDVEVRPLSFLENLQRIKISDSDHNRLLLKELGLSSSSKFLETIELVSKQRSISVKG